MTIIQDAKLDMYNAVISHCTLHADIMASIPALQQAFSTFKDTVASIDNTAQRKAQVITGITADKNKLRKDLAQLAADIACKIYAYATIVRNNELKQQVRLSVNRLLKLKDEAFFGACINITTSATANLAALTPYAITADAIKSFSDLIEEYKIAVPRPRNAVSIRSTQVQALKELFNTADDILKSQLDKMIATFRVSNTAFSSTYFANRIIVDPHHTTTQIKGTITDDVNNEPLSGAKVEVVGREEMVTTKATGKYALKPLEPGTYTIKISKEGFRPKTVIGLLLKLGQAKTIDQSLSAGNE